MSFGFGFALPAYPLRGGGGNNPFNQSGPTLDLSFVDGATNVGDQLGPDTYTLNTDFITPEYQVAAQYAVWENGVGLAQKTFSQIVTFTRASTATYFNSTGTLTSAAINEARFDYDPATLLARGLLIEESRTNSIRNNTMQGAVAGTPGTQPTNWTGWTGTANGMTASINSVGTETGIAYIDWRYQGTYTGATGTAIGPAFEAGNQISASVGQTWTESVYVSLAAGSVSGVTIQFRQAERDSGGTFLTSGDSSAIVPTATPLASQRASYSRTTTNASTAFVQPILRIALTNGQTYDFTLRIGLPQMELGAFATSVIPTTTTALTRSADVASVNTLSPWYNATEGTLFAEYVATNSAQNNAATAFSDGTNNNRMIIRATNASTQTVFIGVSSGSTQWAGTITAALLNTITKSAFGYKVDDISWVRNGGTVGTDTTAIIPTVTGLKLGADGDGTLFLNGYLRRITYYPRRLSNAALQTVTT